MELPALLPERLIYPREATSDAMLFEILAGTPTDLITFFEYACGDETWLHQHASFMQDALYWMTREVFEDKLGLEYVQQVATAIHSHYEHVSPFVDLNIICQLGEQQFPTSGILLVASSPILRERLLAECRGSGDKTLSFENINPHLFEMMIESINKGKVASLWKEEQQVILDLLDEANALELHNLVNQCQEGLLRYISRQNIATLLRLALTEGYSVLREGCLYYLNESTDKAHFPLKNPEILEMEFLEFNNDTLDLFSRIAPITTHLTFHGGTTAEAPFNQVLEEARNLVGVNLSGTLSYSDRLTLLPNQLRELDLSQCRWLNDHNLKILLTRCRQLETLKLARNTQLGNASWTLLHSLPHLKSLDISQCNQIVDPTFKLMLCACRHIEELYVGECNGLTDQGFYEIAFHTPDLRALSVRRSPITDAPLVEIASRCTLLEKLDIRYCDNLSGKLLFTLRSLNQNLKIIKEESDV